MITFNVSYFALIFLLLILLLQVDCGEDDGCSDADGHIDAEPYFLGDCIYHGFGL